MCFCGRQLKRFDAEAKILDSKRQAYINQHFNRYVYWECPTCGRCNKSWLGKGHVKCGSCDLGYGVKSYNKLIIEEINRKFSNATLINIKFVREFHGHIIFTLKLSINNVCLITSCDIDENGKIKLDN